MFVTLYQNVKNNLSFPVFLFFFPRQLRNRDTFLDLFLINILRSNFLVCHPYRSSLFFNVDLRDLPLLLYFPNTMLEINLRSVSDIQLLFPLLRQLDD